jgi:hypothetical protein
MMVSLDMIPSHDEGAMRMARYDLSRMRGSAKQRKAISTCNGYRVFRSDRQIRVEFVDTTQPEDKQVRMRFIYALMPPFA